MFGCRASGEPSLTQGPPRQRGVRAVERRQRLSARPRAGDRPAGRGTRSPSHRGRSRAGSRSDRPAAPSSWPPTLVRGVRARADHAPRYGESGSRSDRRWERTPLTRLPERVGRACRRPQGGRMTVLDAFDLAVCDDAELGRRAAAGDARARRELIERYLPLARRLALRYRRSGEAPDDLIQVASLALLKTVDRWDPAMGYAFSSYAVPTILGELRRYFRDATWIVRPPRGLIELTLLVESERQKFGAELGREPTVAELAERLDRPHAAVSAAVEAHASRVPRSLHSTADDAEREPVTIGDVIGLDDAEYERAEARTTIERLASVLDPRARDVLRMRFQHDLRQWEIAAAIGCSQMQVSRIIRTSLERLSAHASMVCGGWSMSDTTEGRRHDLPTRSRVRAR